MVSARIAHIAPCTEAEGPGKRFALWFQGCPLRCPGCCNPEYLSFEGGEERSIADLKDALTATLPLGIEGLTLLGGEPFAHVPAALALAEHAHSLGLSVMVFTGYTIEQLHESNDPTTARLLSCIDLLVDGPYLREQPDHSRRWIGSTNQHIHFLSERYSKDDPCWRERNTLEIRVRGGEIAVNGFPATDSRGLWKGWKRVRPAGVP